MKQSSFDLNLSTRRTRKQAFLQQMDTVVPWAALVEFITPYYSEGRNGRPPFALETMLRVHFMQQWFSLSDPAMEEAFFDTPLYREFAQFSAFGRLPDESTILRFRHRLEKHKLADQILATVNELLVQRGLLLKVGTAVDATLIPAPSSSKNNARAQDPEIHSSQKGNEWHFGMKAHIGVDADSGLVNTVRGTSGNVPMSPSRLLKYLRAPHRTQNVRPFKTSYKRFFRGPQGLGHRFVSRIWDSKPVFQQPARPTTCCTGRRQLWLGDAGYQGADNRAIKRQFGFAKVRCRGLKKNTLQIKTLFALSNLWMVRHKLIGARSWVFQSIPK